MSDLPDHTEDHAADHHDGLGGDLDGDLDGGLDGGLDAALGVRLRWRADTLPDDVEAPRPAQADDDPAHDPLPSLDPAWDAALALLALDPEFQRRRALVDDVTLHVVVRDADEATLTAYPDDEAAEDVVLVVPVTDHLDADGEALPLEERVQVHVDALVTLLVEVQSALGRD